MSKLKYHTGVTPLTRSIEGSTFQSGAFGYSMKNKSKQKFFKTPWQLVMINYLLSCSRAWHNLSAIVRQNWRTWAVAYPQPHKRNPAKFLNGYNVFQKRNFYRFISLGSSFSFMTTPANISYPEETVVITPKADTAQLLIDCKFTNNDSTLDCIIFVSPTVSSGRSFVDHSWRLMVVTDNSNKVIDITDIFISKYAKVPLVGQKLFASVVFCGIDNGQFWFNKNTPLICVVPGPEPPVLYLLTVNFGTIHGPYLLTVNSGTISV